MADLKASPQNANLAALARFLSKAKEKANQYEVLPQVPLLGGTGVGDLLLGKSPEEVTEWSYGNAPMFVPQMTRIPQFKPGRAESLADTLFAAGDASGLASLAKNVGKAAGKQALKKIDDAMLSGGLPASPSFVIKPKGGNWAPGSIDKSLRGLKRAENLDRPDDAKSLNQWIDKKLARYVQNEMATPEDPIRAMADRGVLHVDPGYMLNPDPNAINQMYGEIKKSFPQLNDIVGQMGETPTGRMWENAADYHIGHPSHGDYGPEYEIGKFVRSSDLGFDHLVDELKNAMNPESGLPRHLQIQPKDLQKITVPQAVDRVAKINEWRAAQKAEADKMLANNAATVLHKEYPEGYRWVELKTPDAALPEGFTLEYSPNSEMWQVYNPEREVVSRGASEQEALNLYGRQDRIKQLQDALKYEGDTMGHCVGGYCDDVASGETRIYSLRDAKGEPHVTIEVRRPDIGRAFGLLPDEERHAIAQKVKDEQFGGVMPGVREEAAYWKALDDEYVKRYGNPKDEIRQIKGKQNLAPKEDYLPFVQDFVKSRQWGDVRDLRNSGLRRINGNFVDQKEFQNALNDARKFLDEHPSFEAARKAEQDYLDFKGAIPSPEFTRVDRARGAQVDPEFPYSWRELRAGLDDPDAYPEDNFDTTYKVINRLREKLNPTEGMKRGGPVRVSMDAMRVATMGKPQHKKIGGSMKAVGQGLQKLFPGRTYESLSSAEKSAVTRYARAMENPAVRRRESFSGPTIVEDTQKIKPVEKVSPEEILRRPLMPLTGDVSDAGKKIKQIKGIPLERDVDVQGGFKFGNLQQMRESPIGWASMEDAAQKKIDQAIRIAQATGESPFAVYSAMSPESINFSTPVVEGFLNQLHAINPSKAAIKELNRDMRLPFGSYKPRPDFVGFESPDVIMQLRGEGDFTKKGAGDLRKKAVELMSKAKYRDMGFPVYDDIAEAIIDPSLVGAPRGLSGSVVFKTDPAAPAVKDPDIVDHLSYNTGIPRDVKSPVIALRDPIPAEVLFRDIFRQGLTEGFPLSPLQIKQGKIRRPLNTEEILGALMMRNDLYQPATQEHMDYVMDYMRKNFPESGYKDGGKVSIEQMKRDLAKPKKKAEGGLTADDLIVEERKL